MSFLGLSDGFNYSVYALPLYYGLCLIPHGYAARVATQGQVKNWDNRNPRAASLKDGLRQRLDAATYAKYERAEAAHYNSLESFPLVAAATLAGTMARLPNGELNTFAAGIGMLRALYIVLYIFTERQRYTPARSAVWIVGLVYSLRTLTKAGSALM